MISKNLFYRIKSEIEHLKRKSWSMADVGAHWDATDDYDDINSETYSYFRRFVDGYRLSNLPDNARVLDICARTGNGTLYFYQHGKVNSAVCVDVSMKMGMVCIQRLKEAGLEDFIWLPLDDYVLPLRDNAFNVVLCFETVEHFSKPERLIQELSRVMQLGGILILTTPNILWEPVHALAAIVGYHHSEGPHSFIPLFRLRGMVEDAGFIITREETTVLVPGGSKALIKLGEWVEARTRNTIMPLLGLRRIIVAYKNSR